MQLIIPIGVTEVDCWMALLRMRISISECEACRWHLVNICTTKFAKDVDQRSARHLSDTLHRRRQHLIDGSLVGPVGAVHH